MRLALVDLRLLAPNDWELWREIRLRALADAPEAFGSTKSDWVDADQRRWQQRLSDVPFNVVAFARDVAVGQVSGTIEDRDGCVELISMWVAPSGRGSGIADALVTAVKNHARQGGANAVRLSVRRSNTRAIRLYERAGFVPASDPGDEPDEIAMCCQL
jgi:ribosomal protein S18 acetylase RimI-like enzyme